MFSRRASAAEPRGRADKSATKAEKRKFVLNYTKHDRLIWEEELSDFVPERIFDAHCHLLNTAFIPDGEPTKDSRHNVDLEAFKHFSNMLYPGRKCGFLFLGVPIMGMDIRTYVDWFAREAGGEPCARMHRLTAPSCRPEDIERDVRSLGFTGLKIYRKYSVTGDIANCRIHEFFPHEQMEVADQLGLWVTLHLSRSEGCADKHNLEDLAEYTNKRYPNIRWILAHCARSFTYYPIRQAVERLRDMPNIWYDLSAVTDVRPHLTLFQKEDVKRLMYGSDGVDSTCFHGAYVALGRSWQALLADKAGLKYPHCEYRPILAVYEQLLAMKHAAEIAELSREDVEKIFWGNAQRELKINITAGRTNNNT